MTSYLDPLAERIQRLAEPDYQMDETARLLYRIYAVLLLAKGAAATEEDVHNAWAAWVADTCPEHHALRPFNQLAPHVQKLDEPYVKAIRSLAPDAGQWIG